MKAIIFDFDGTLDNIDEERLAALRALFPDSSNNERLAILTQIEKVDREHPDWAMLDIVTVALQQAKGLRKGVAKRLARRYLAAREKMIDKSVKNFLSKYSKDYVYFILTKNSTAKVMALLQTAGLLKFFKKIYSTRDFSATKPDISLLKKILAENRLNPKNCIMVGDDIVGDILPAKALGMKAILRVRLADGAFLSWDALELH
jgi:HAD superfamily hydrolase (TIGR01509 family)